ncbi:response regulator [Peptostreptococcus canis]|uniref:Stage 0 sporulation protein A homolog n=1 Tax=Peptostreptococcus canis TaxID=1159213 RepID=A0ABR6TM53_9FIRM|nr:response regulator transcription factor [Peptostreptococcus canis]MBC2576501.1 response regulator transcription factor [Peptostreptococcus canis]MBP1998663.1 two-component system nitrate/nitrite response regulator NarL/two-component system nitrate/nitrite response regulator NarP [Peptostreptococcus canis]
MILVLDDHPIARQGLEAIIHMYKPEEEILQAGNVSEAIDYMKESNIDMVFVDINLGKESGFDFLEWMKRKHIDTKTFMITSSSDENDFLYAKSLGVDAYLLKDAFIDDIVYGLKVVGRGEKFYSAALIESIGDLSDEEKLLNTLTKREKEVLCLLNNGYSNMTISKKLFISEGTVKKHISNILSKLELENRVEAILFANRNRAKLKLSMKFSS